jgi:hypothetical protein
LSRGTQILGFLIRTAIRKPKPAIAVALCVLAALAGTMTYAGFLVVGVLADHLGTGRAMAGLLLAGVLARFPWIRQGKLRIVGLLPKAVRRPFIVSLFAFCLLSLIIQGEYVQALFTGFATVFLLVYPRLRKNIFKAGKSPREGTDDKVIDGEFREKKE